MTTTTYSKLRSGAWGVRTTALPTIGGTVSVTKRDGEVKRETIQQIVWTDGKVWLCAVEPTQRPASSRPWRSTRPFIPCGYPGCNPGYCDECDGEGMAGEYRRR